MSENRYDLVLLDWDVPPVTIAGPILIQATGLTPLDVQPLLRKSQGILCHGLDAPKAQAAADALMSADIHVAVVPAGTIADPPAPWPLKEAELSPGGLRVVTDVYGNRTDIPWTDIAVVAAAHVVKVVTSTKTEVKKPGIAKRIMFYGAQVAVMGAPLVRMRPTTITKTYDEAIRMCSLAILSVNPLRHFRVDATQFNYAYLGERLSNSSAFNFAALVTDTLAFAANAATNLTPEDMNGVATRWPVYASPHDLEKRMAWMLWRRQLPTDH